MTDFPVRFRSDVCPVGRSVAFDEAMRVRCSHNFDARALCPPVGNTGITGLCSTPDSLTSVGQK